MNEKTIIPGPRVLFLFSRRELTNAIELGDGIIGDRAPLMPTILFGTVPYMHTFRDYDVVMVSRLMYLDQKSLFDDIAGSLKKKLHEVATKTKAMCVFGDMRKNDTIHPDMLSMDVSYMKAPLYHYALEMAEGMVTPYLDFTQSWHSAPFYGYVPSMDLLQPPANSPDPEWDMLEAIRTEAYNDCVEWAAICQDEDDERDAIEQIYGAQYPDMFRDRDKGAKGKRGLDAYRNDAYEQTFCD